MVGDTDPPLPCLRFFCKLSSYKHTVRRIQNWDERVLSSKIPIIAMKASIFFALPCANALSSLIIDTSSGFVQGKVDATTPNVVQFLGVPYAEAPIGERRWRPSWPQARAGGILDATQFGPSCPQYASNKSTTWLTDAPEFNIEPRDYQSEDCLSVNIWAPWQNSTTPAESCGLPVIVWIHGGSFQTGGAATPYHNPSRWVERSGEHIVVAIK